MERLSRHSIVDIPFSKESKLFELCCGAGRSSWSYVVPISAHNLQTGAMCKTWQGSLNAITR